MTVSQPRSQGPARREPVPPAAAGGGPGPARHEPAPAATETRWDSGPPAPTEQELAEHEAILAAEIAAGILDQPPDDEFAAFLADPDSGPPEGPDAWLAELPSPVRDALLEARAAAAGPEPEGPFPAGVITHDGTGPGGSGFADGSVLDQMEPGPVLAGALDDAWREGLAGRSDDELAGITLGWGRIESRAAAGQLAAVAELARRRAEHGDWRVQDQTDTELALLLTLTRRSAGTLLDFATSLDRLPATQAALAAGRIDRARADVIAYETAMLDETLAAAVEQLVIEDAARLTTSGLRARLRRLVIAADPEAARRRAKHAARDARVELYDERSGGTAALCGRDLPVAAALAADQRIDTAAKTLKASGVPATLPQLRAAVFLGLLTGQDPLTFLPSPESQSEEGAEDSRNPSEPPGSWPAPADRDDSARPGQDPSPPPAPAGPGDSAQAEQDPSPPPAPADQDAPGRAPRWGLRGSVHLTMPLTSWLGLTSSPGEITAFGPVTAETCRQLADEIAANPGSRWCLTLTDSAGHAVGHGCARKPPPPATDLAAVTAWLTSLKTGPVEAGICTHAREVPGYRIPESLQHIVDIRQKTCSNPICSRPATRCDCDHTLAYDKGGRSCECGVAPNCRTDHQVKQAPGWHLEQPSPGVLVWRPPHGRRYTVTPGVYPT